jgi:hypothetical protein
MAFLSESESVDRLGAESEGAGDESVVLLDEKSRLMVASPERGCLSGCAIATDDVRLKGAFIQGSPSSRKRPCHVNA